MARQANEHDEKNQAQTNRKDLNPSQIRLLAEIGRKVEGQHRGMLPEIGTAGVKLNKAQQNQLKRIAKSFGHPAANYRFDGGQPLAEAANRRWYLTPLGLEVARRARLVVQSLDWLHEAVLPDEADASLRYTCHPSHVVRFHSVLAPALSGAVPIQPVEVASNHRSDGGARMTALLDSGRVILAIGPAGLQVPDRIERRLLYTSSLRAVVSASSPIGKAARLKVNRTIGLEQLSGYDVLVAPVGHRSRSLLDDAFERADRRFAPAVELSDINALQALSDGLRRVAVMPDDSFAGRPPSHWPVVVDDDGEPLTDEHWLYWSSDGDSDDEPWQTLNVVVGELRKHREAN